MKQLHLVGFLKKVRNQISKWKLSDWKHLAMLLEKGIALPNAIEIIGYENKIILEKMEAGKHYEEVLLDHCSGSFYQYLYFFIQTVSLKEAIMMTLQYVEFEKALRKQFLQKTLYPAFVFGCAICTLLLFRNQILPMLMTGFDFESNGWLFVLLDLMMYLSIILFLIICFVVCYIVIHPFIPDTHHRLLCILNAYVPWFQDYVTYQFCGYYRILINGGLSSKQVFAFIAQNSKQYLISLCGKRIEADLTDGMTLTNAFKHTKLLSQTLIQLIEIGSATANMEEMLKEYIEKQHYLMEKRMKLVANGTIAITYSYVAVLVLSVYQIILLPLQLLEQM